MRIFITIPLLAAAVISQAPTLQAHPIPDIPVRSHFESDGTCQINVEVDIRCFSEDPLNEPYLLKWVLEEMDSSEKDDLRAKAAALIQEGIATRFEPSGSIRPEFVFDFTGKEGNPLENIDDPVMLTGTWNTSLPEKVTGFQIEALSSCQFDLRFLNWLKGQKVERMQVLFPGEKSFLLDLSAVAIAAPGPLATPSHYLPIVLITAVVAGAIAGLRWARRNRSL